MKKIEGKNG